MTAVISTSVRWVNVCGSTVVLNHRTGRYFSLNPVAGRVWEALVNRADMATFVLDYAHMFRLSPERAREDLDRILVQLSQHGIVEYTTADAA